MIKNDKKVENVKKKKNTYKQRNDFPQLVIITFRFRTPKLYNDLTDKSRANALCNMTKIN